MGPLSKVYSALKTESEVTHDLERMVHAHQWTMVLAFSKILDRLNGPFPVDFFRRLLTVYISFSANPVERKDGSRIDDDPTGRFRRARPAAIALNQALGGWDGALPAPSEVIAAARDMVVASGHPAAGKWDEHTVPADAWGQLLWPDDYRGAPAGSP